jgi:Tetratricopeptide repeat
MQPGGSFVEATSRWVPMNLVKRRILLKTFVFCCAIALSFGRWLGAPVHIMGAPVETDDANRCRTCHAYEVDGFARSKMAASMRMGEHEPEGLVRAPAATITMHADKSGSWQTLKSGSDTTSYHVDYVIGSGTHASGYIVNLSDHLFQSPVAYYRGRGGYDLAPGYEAIEDPDFTRPVQEGCLFCHAGSFQAIAGSTNWYAKPPFLHLAIGCDRCHGPTAAHLADPHAHNIVNPAKLEPASRDSICEQCHLKGVARVLNPGKRLTDFQAGTPLEDTFTVYHDEAPKGTENVFRVISHAEQLAVSECKRKSGDRMWCGTCHDPHNEPTETASYYRSKCLQCHATTIFAAGHPSSTSDCVSCHMPKRNAADGGHTAFTDHRIQRRPVTQVDENATAIVAWRPPPANLATRNLGIASVQVGLERRSPEFIVGGYRMLTEVQSQFSEDSEMYSNLGAALMGGRQYAEAMQAFTLAVRYDLQASPKQANLGLAYAALGDPAEAERHLEKAMDLDPLNLAAASQLISLYKTTGDTAKADQLSQRITSMVQTGKHEP